MAREAAVDVRIPGTADKVVPAEMLDSSAAYRFEVSVPPELMEGRWKICLVPDVFLIGSGETVLDSLRLEKMVLKGQAYQDYRQGLYDAYCRELKEIADSDRFRGGELFRIFAQRNMPEIYSFRFDPDHVCTRKDTLLYENGMKNYYGVAEDEVIRRYGNLPALQDLRRRKAALQTVNDPNLPEEGACVDTVLGHPSVFTQNYIDSVTVRSGYVKASVRVSGAVYDGDDNVVCLLEPSVPVEFLFSSVVDLVSEKERTIARVIYRKVDMNTSFDIRFAAGKSQIDTTLAGNAAEVKAIEKTIVEVLSNKEYVVNSISVTANCSPEGGYNANESLSRRRSQAVSKYFAPIVKSIADSLGVSDKARFQSRSVAENWETLNLLVANDTVLTPAQKETYAKKIAIVKNPDTREQRLRKEPFFSYVKDQLYPQLRTVNFNFHLTRVGMKKDAITVYDPDTTYSAGVNLLKQRDFEAALAILKDYPDDYNLAICYAALGRDADAAAVLKPLERTAEIDYLYALVLSRLGQKEEALSRYKDACHKDASYQERGKKDPDIYNLTK